MPTYLERYLAGEHERVWAELLALGPRVREEPVATDAYAVAHETMRRVRHNIELLVPRLEAAGYQFGYTWVHGRKFPSGLPDPVFSPPSHDAAQLLTKLETRVGDLPVSLRAFYEVVGAVNFVGEPPSTWSSAPDDLDALYVYPLEGTLGDVYPWLDQYGDLTEEEFRSANEDDPCDFRAYAALPRDCWLVPISPDEWLKYDISGCGAYEIAAPNPAVDARVLTERHRTTFVNYLRICLRWAGFPKLELVAKVPSAISVVAELTHDLLLF